MRYDKELPAGRYYINGHCFEVSERGVCLIQSHGVKLKVLNHDGSVDTSLHAIRGWSHTGGRISGESVRDALVAQEKWTKEQKTVAVKDGWTIQRDNDKLGRVIALSSYKPRSVAFLERDRNRFLRVRVDNQTVTKSKSVPVKVVLSLLSEYVESSDYHGSEFS
jgi:hypothetical protein